MAIVNVKFLIAKDIHLKNVGIVKGHIMNKHNFNCVSRYRSMPKQKCDCGFEELQGFRAALQDGRPFVSVAVVEDELARDGDFNRVIAAGAIRFDSTPIPLLYAHDSDQVIGRVDSFYQLSEASQEIKERVMLESMGAASADMSKVWIAEGYFSADATEHVDLVEKRMSRGVSVGAGQADYEETDDAFMFTDFQVVELSVTALPAIGSAVIWMADTEFVEIPEREQSLTMFGAAKNSLNIPVRPPSSWFDLPDFEWGEFDNVDVLHADNNGRFIGYLGFHGVPHGSFKGKKVYMPKEKSHDFFHLKSVTCEDGTKVLTGTITFDTEHSAKGSTPEQIKKHFEKTGWVAADVRIIDDGKGYLAVGALRPEITENQIREINGSCLSGEWEPEPGKTENRLRAIAAVNIPAFSNVETAISYSLSGGMVFKSIKGSFLANYKDGLIKKILSIDLKNRHN